MDASEDAAEGPLPGEPELHESAVDYWSFVNLAQRNLRELDEDVDLDANRLILGLYRAGNLIAYDLEATIYRPKGRTWPSFRLLWVVWHAGDVTVSEAAKLTGMTKASVSSLTRTLVKDDLLRKVTAEHDRRAVTLSLTPAGRKLIEELFREQNRAESDWASPLTDIEITLFNMLLQKLLNSERANDARMRRLD